MPAAGWIEKTLHKWANGKFVNDGKFMKLPVGSAARLDSAAAAGDDGGAPTATAESDAPTVAWCTPKRSFCAGHSLASAVAHFGDDAGAKAIKAHAPDAWKADESGEIPGFDALSSLLEEVNTARVAGWSARWARPAEKDILAPGFDPPDEPLLLQLSATHAATLCGRWLFDANFSHAKPLSRESLDEMLLRTHAEERFSKVKRAVRLSAGASIKKHVRKIKRERAASA